GIHVRTNLIYNSGTRHGQGDGIDVKGGLGWIEVVGNTITNCLDPFGDGIRAITLQGSLTNSYWLVEGNIIYGNNAEDGQVDYGDSWAGFPGTNIFRNNLIIGSAGATRQNGLRYYSNTNTYDMTTNLLQV